MPRLKRKRISIVSKYEHRSQQQIRRSDAVIRNIDHSYAATEPLTVVQITPTFTNFEEGYDETSMKSHDEIQETSNIPCMTEGVVYVPEIGQTIDISTTLTHYQHLRQELITLIGAEPQYCMYYVNRSVADIQICENYSSDNPAIKLCVVIRPDFTAEVFVHRLDLASDHAVWTDMPSVYDNVLNVKSLLWKLKRFNVCMGNPDEQFQELIPLASEADSSDVIAFRESDFGAVRDSVLYNSTIRTFQCTLLVRGMRCKHCATYRRALISRISRLEQRQLTCDNQSRIGPGMRHVSFRKEDFILKINEQKEQIKNLQSELNKMRRQLHREMGKNVK